MPEIVTKKLGTYIGAEVLDADRDRLLADDDLPQACLDALEEHSVLLFRELDIDDETQAAFCRKLAKPRSGVPRWSPAGHSASVLVDSYPVPDATALCSCGHFLPKRSNSPFRTPPRNACHSSGVNRRTAPSASLLLRTPISSSGRLATSTQLPFEKLSELLTQ